MKSIIVLALCILLVPAADLVAQGSDPVMPADTENKVKTPSGLGYCVLKAGNGDAHPKLGDTVTVHYSGWLAADGSLFDSSRKRGTPASFMLGRVIPGWNEGVQLMTKGAHFKFHIPAALGYGDRGAGPKIPGGADLVFEVELLDWTVGEPLPEMPAVDEQKCTKTESGLEISSLKEGSGNLAGPKDLVIWKYAIWTAAEKQLADCSEFNKGARKVATTVGSDHPFLAELAKSAKPGQRLFVRVPPAQLVPAARVPDPSQVPETFFLLECEKIIGFERAEGAKIEKTESGIEIETVVEGTGDAPTAASTVVCNYAGWLQDGSTFDASFKHGKPATFGLNGVIKGWTEGLQKMKKGGIAKLTIPAELAYGANPRPGIPANSMLIFWIELIDIL